MELARSLRFLFPKHWYSRDGGNKPKQTQLKNRGDITPWRAIGDLLNGMRVDSTPEGAILDVIGATDQRRPPRDPAPLFGCIEKTIGNPTQLFPHAASLDAATAAAYPAVTRWLDMLDSLRPFNVKGQIAGVHRYLAAAHDLAPIASVVRSLNWTGPISRGHRDDDTADAALARFVSLTHLGIHMDRLRLVWLADAEVESDWVVTTVLLDGTWLVLDHYHGDIATDDAYLDALPYFSLNAEKCCLHWHPGVVDGGERALQRLAGQMRFGRA